jgi:uncharacterized repeat protein (TIGR01451 family)
MNKSIGIAAMCIVGLLWQLPAYAARSFSIALVSPAPAEFDMGTTGAGTFRVTNSGNQDTITKLRIRINNGDHFSGTTTAPAGWTATLSSASGGGYNTVTFTATAFANGISPGGGFKDFFIAIIFHSVSADTTERLRDVRASYTTGNGGNTNVTVSKQPSWTLKSLLMTMTPSSLAVPRSCVGAFTLTMQITNRSTSGLTGATSVPKPPTLNALSGGASASTTSNPANLTLSAGANGSQVWTYNTNANTGTISFTAFASDSGGARTSRTITSPVITVTTASCLIADFNAVPQIPTCKFSGDTVTFTMRVTNNTGVTLSNVVPSALSTSGTASISSISAPSPASVATMINGAVQNFTWTATITGNAYDTYALSGYASATGGYQSQTTTTLATDVNGFKLNAAPDVNGDSTNQEMAWNITNHGCNSVKTVSIPIPSGFAWSGDAYSLVFSGVGVTTESWTANLVGSNVVFTAPAGSEMAIDASSSTFNLTMATPSVNVAALYTLSATVTDTNASPRTRTVTDPVTVNPFNSGSPNPNQTTSEVWRELLP